MASAVADEVVRAGGGTVEEARGGERLTAMDLKDSAVQSDALQRQLSKYTNNNPIHRFTLGRFFDRITAELAALGPRAVLDLGCGEGLFLQELERRGTRFADYLGLDLRDDALTMARSLHPDRRFVRADVLQWSAPECHFDLVIASQVLEHLTDPGRVLERLTHLTTQHLLLTVPWEPWFRAMNFLRGRDLRRFGNQPGHLNLWTFTQFKSFVSQHAAILRAMTVFPFTIVIAAPMARPASADVSR